MTRTYTYTNASVTVSATMQALGDQPYHCSVSPDGIHARCFIIEADNPETAARDAYRQWLFATNPLAALFAPSM